MTNEQLEQLRKLSIKMEGLCELSGAMRRGLEEARATDCRPTYAIRARNGRNVCFPIDFDICEMQVKRYEERALKAIKELQEFIKSTSEQ